MSEFRKQRSCVVVGSDSTEEDILRKWLRIDCSFDENLFDLGIICDENVEFLKGNRQLLIS